AGFPDATTPPSGPGPGDWADAGHRRTRAPWIVPTRCRRRRARRSSSRRLQLQRPCRQAYHRVVKRFATLVLALAVLATASPRWSARAAGQSHVAPAPAGFSTDRL